MNSEPPPEDEYLDYFHRFVDARLEGKPIDLESYVASAQLNEEQLNRLREELVTACSMISWQTELLRASARQEQRIAERRASELHPDISRRLSSATLTLSEPMAADARRYFADPDARRQAEDARPEQQDTPAAQEEQTG